MKNYSIEELNRLNIYELRFIAREKYVKSPTTKKREELIDAIISAQNDNSADLKNSFIGRKSKPFELIKTLDKNISFQDYQFENNDYGTIVFKSSYTAYNSPPDVCLKMSGFFAQSQMGYCLLGFENPLYVEMIATIPKLLAKKYGLEIGDFCEVEAKKIYNYELPIVQTISKVNSLEPGVSNRNIFDKFGAIFERMPIMKDGLQVSLDGNLVDFGSKILYSKNNETNLDDLIEKFTDIENTEIVLDLICSTPEVVYKYMENKKIKVFFSLFSDSYIKQKFLHDLTLSYCKNQAANGKNVILILNSIAKLNYLAERQQFEINYQNEPMLIKEFFEISRVLQNGGSFTCIGATQESESEEEILNKITDIIDIKIC